MESQGLETTWTKAFVRTTNSKHHLSFAKNLLNQQFNPSSRENTAWVADITYGAMLLNDNSVMERLFLNLKMERVWQQEYANHQEAIRDISHYSTVFYNQVRLHSKLVYLSPNQFEQHASNLPIMLSEFT